MYRQRLLLTVSDIDSWNDCVSIVDDINKLCAERGWTQGTLLTRTVGRFNELSFELDYPDLASFERENKEWSEDPATTQIMRRLDALRTEDSGYSELWEEAMPV